jgi:very-short-patch-repair endonuclease
LQKILSIEYLLDVKEQKKIKSPFKKEGMFNEATPLMFELAKELRRNMTDAEMILWRYLRAGINGMKFRRQRPIGIYVADFYCHKIKLIIEVDGVIHDKKKIKEHDKKREDDLKNLGYNVARFPNDKVLKEIETVLVDIHSLVENLSQVQNNSKANTSL